MPQSLYTVAAHTIDNSAYPSKKPQLQEGAEGWYRYLSDTASPVVAQFGVKHLLIRQPFPTPLGGGWVKQGDGAGEDTVWRRVPMWGSGYRQAQVDDNDVMWKTFKSGVKRWRKEHPGVKLTCYSGHWGGDPYDPTLKRTSWAEDSILRYARLKGPNRFRVELDRIMTQYDAVKADVMLDASARVGPDSPYFEALAWYSRLTRDDGRDFGVESPAVAFSPLEGLGVNGGAVWGVRRGRINADQWDRIPGPRLVFIHSQTEVIIPGDLGGWSAAYHAQTAKRARECMNYGDVPIIHCWGPLRAGFTSLDEWMDHFAPLDAPPDPPVIADPSDLQGDLTGDGFIGLEDLNLVLQYWGQDVAPGTNGDTTGDGFVGIEDLSAVLGNWNKGTRPSNEELAIKLQNK